MQWVEADENTHMLARAHTLYTHGPQRRPVNEKRVYNNSTVMRFSISSVFGLHAEIFIARYGQHHSVWLAIGDKRVVILYQTICRLDIYFFECASNFTFFVFFAHLFICFCYLDRIVQFFLCGIPLMLPWNSQHRFKDKNSTSLSLIFNILTS